MDKIGLLRMAVRIFYPENSLSKEEQLDVCYGTKHTHTIYFYEGFTDDEYYKKLAKVWRPGATALVFSYEVCDDVVKMKADKKRGQWLPFDTPFSEGVSYDQTERKRNQWTHHKNPPNKI